MPRSYWKNIGRPPVHGQCDCPQCRPLSWLGRMFDWLDSPAGPWSTVLVIGFCLALALAWWYLYPAPPPVTTALRG